MYTLFNPYRIFTISFIFCLYTTTIFAETVNNLTELVITTTREEKLLSEIPESIEAINSEEIKFILPAHPSEVLNRISGVHINNLSGEGHMTSIRQPITTKGVYLFLEDGIPTRPTGLFNHNALYEINIPQAERIEIIKGPGSALYGSDSIGGIVNSITRSSPLQKEFEINPETGADGWNRLLTSIGAPINKQLGYRLDLNITDNKGFRQEAEYSRNASTLRLDGFLPNDINFKTILSYNYIDQSGTSSLELDDFQNNTKKNLYHNDVGRREVDALRLSTEFSFSPNENKLLSFTPYLRDNQMKLMPSWMLSYDPNDRDYQFQSYGFLAKQRIKMPTKNTELITGLDIDYSPSTYKEVRLSTTKSGDIYTSTTPTGRVNYDYEADQLSISPYIQTEWLTENDIRLSAGLRYDYFKVEYKDLLDSSVSETVGWTKHYRPDSQDISYNHLSPKLGLVYDYSSNNIFYVNYRRSFRVPSIGQLFRSGSTTNTVDLKPVKTDSYEIGSRGQLFGWLNYDSAIYHMKIEDDIVTYIDSNTRKTTNAGETEHQGIELELSSKITDELNISTTWSYTNQEYKSFTAIVSGSEVSYAGYDVGKAPKHTGNLTLQYMPSYLKNTKFEFEWESVGKYYTDETNTNEYLGHDLYNIRANHKLNDSIEIYGRVINITDELYSTYTSNQVGSSAIQYRPGLPRTAYIGLRMRY